MRKLKWGIIFVVTGLVIWAANMGWLGLNWTRDWPWIFVILGLFFVVGGIGDLFKASAKSRRKSQLDRVLRELERGKISVEEALKRIRGG